MDKKITAFEDFFDQELQTLQDIEGGFPPEILKEEQADSIHERIKSALLKGGLKETNGETVRLEIDEILESLKIIDADTLIDENEDLSLLEKEDFYLAKEDKGLLFGNLEQFHQDIMGNHMEIERLSLKLKEQNEQLERQAREKLIQIEQSHEYTRSLILDLEKLLLNKQNLLKSQEINQKPLQQKEPLKQEQDKYRTDLPLFKEFVSRKDLETIQKEPLESRGSIKKEKEAKTVSKERKKNSDLKKPSFPDLINGKTVSKRKDKEEKGHRLARIIALPDLGQIGASIGLSLMLLVYLLFNHQVKIHAVDANTAQIDGFIDFACSWLSKIGGVVALVGGVIFALAWQREDAEGKSRGLMTLMAGFMLVAISGSRSIFGL